MLDGILNSLNCNKLNVLASKGGSFLVSDCIFVYISKLIFTDQSGHWSANEAYEQ